MLGGARAGFHGDGAQRGGAAFGNNHSVDPSAVGYAQQGAEVLGVFDAVEREQKPGSGGRRRGLEQVFDIEELLGVHDGDNALVSGGSGHLGELLAGFLADADTGVPALGDQAGEAIVRAFAGDHDVVKAAAAGAQGLSHRMHPVEDVHESSVEGWASDSGICRTGEGVDTYAMPQSKPKRFKAILEPTGDALRWVIARVPFDPAEVWPVRKGRRVRGEINGYAFRTALFPEAGGKKHVLLVNKKMQAGARARAGDTVQISLEPDLEEREAMVPPELAKALKADRGLRRYFEQMTESRRSDIGRYVSEPKTPASRTKRAEEVAEWFLLALEGEREVPPILRVAFQRQPAAREGWEAMSAVRRRNHLLSIFHLKTSEAREKRTLIAIEDALKLAKRIHSSKKAVEF